VSCGFEVRNQPIASIVYTFHLFISRSAQMRRESVGMMSTS
jgi:hypothetical protein